MDATQTLTVNPIHARTLQPGQKGQQISGLRVQYVLEISMGAVHLAWATSDEAKAEAATLGSGDEAQIQAILEDRAAKMQKAVEALEPNPLVTHAKVYAYDTLVIGHENGRPITRHNQEKQRCRLPRPNIRCSASNR